MRKAGSLPAEALVERRSFEDWCGFSLNGGKGEKGHPDLSLLSVEFLDSEVNLKFLVFLECVGFVEEVVLESLW